MLLCSRKCVIMEEDVQVVVKYNRTNHLETLNWHNRDTGARVGVPINSGARPAHAPRSGVPRPDGSPGRGAAAVAAQPSPSVPDGNPADPMAHAARMQQQALPYGLTPRVNLLNNMNFNWQVCAHP